MNDLADVSVHICSYGVPAGDAVALLGDSHAAQWFPALELIARRRAWHLLVAVKTQFPVAFVVAHHLSPPGPFPQCDAWRTAIVDSLIARHPKLVVISSAAVYVESQDPGVRAPLVSAGEWCNGLATLLRRLDAASIATVVIRDTPKPLANIPQCLSRSRSVLRGGIRCGLERSSALNRELAAAEDAAVASSATARIIDMNDDLCSATMCLPVVNGMLVCSDAEHMTATFSRSLAGTLEHELLSVRR